MMLPVFIHYEWSVYGVDEHYLRLCACLIAFVDLANRDTAVNRTQTNDSVTF